MKIIAAIVYIIAVFLCDNALSMALMLISAIVLVLISRIPVTIVLRSVRPVMFIIAFTAIVNLFWSTGEGEPLISLGFVQIYAEGIANALLLVSRIFVLVIGTSILLTYTTTPIALTDGLEQLLYPLKKLGLPVHDFAMIMTIALRFIPTLMEEAEKIMSAQKARGADFSSGGLIQRAKALIPILIPLFSSSIRHALDLATAMECRCYRGGVGRTRMKVLKFGADDIICLACFTGFVLLILAVDTLGSAILPL